MDVQICSSVAADFDISCDFEAGMCGWANEENEALNWRRIRGAAAQGTTINFFASINMRLPRY